MLDLLGYMEESRIVAYVEARGVTLDGYYDEDRDEIVFCKWEDRKGKPVVKDWKKAMKRSGLFTEEFPATSES